MQKEIYLSSDHGGFNLKEQIFDYLCRKNFNAHNLGTNSLDSVDYPDYSRLVVNKIKSQPNAIGILICGTGIGMSISANRHDQIRAALCTDIKMAKLSRQHNNANVLVLGGRIIKHNIALNCVDKFLSTEFEGGRHIKRIDKLSNPPTL